MSGRARAATIVDVARHADVAVGTVSRFLNGQFVRQAKRERIEEAIRVLSYSRNAVAQAMRTERTNMVAMLVPGYDEFFSGVLGHTTQHLSNAGLVLLTHKHDGNAKVLAQALDYFLNHRVDAVIMPGSEDVRPQIEAMIERGIPIVFYNNDLPGVAADRVLVNARGASDTAASHLIDLGHRRIAAIAGLMAESSAVDRLEGYKDALRRHDIDVDPALIVGGTWRRQDGYAGMRALMALAEPPTAVLASNNVLASGALQYMREHDITAGTDLSIISFDDVEFLKLLVPPVSAIAQPIAAIGEYIAENILMRLEHGARDEPRTIYLDCNVILRGTTRPPRQR